jgi:hypothetical protein
MTYYKIAQAKKHGFEIHIIRFYDAKGNEISTHEFMSDQGCQNKLREFRARNKSR